MSTSFEAAAVRATRTVGPVVDLSTRRTMSLVPPPVQLPPATPPTGPFLTKPVLTDREIQVLTGWIRCDSKTAVAKSLFLSLGTINTHLTRIRAKYAAVGRPASTKASLVARALQDGLVDIADL
ncbi:response regulator transcription factor [Rhodococcoides kyotonense]|uniref:Regulatory protein, luxR family n=1 Tax=Rhodococcoides kyotonense TaxID=398843 RepID=A0A239KGN5_9NOCA|nr:LuxR C-terminal-related transcriptional regulator [Rhodococcus kyotonensis]SNT17140.1 regulatory protein, luxR family [Rhodococcus kyotonensis]